MSDDTGGTATDQGSGQDQLRALRVEARALVDTLPGPLRRIVVRNAEHVVEVEWPAVGARSGGEPAPEFAETPARPPVNQPDPAMSGATDLPTHAVLAPLVGTYYAAPQPGAAALVEVGDRIEIGQTVAIVEAMKLMNHVVAERPGWVVEVLVADGGPVEFAQPLIRLADADPDDADTGVGTRVEAAP